MPFVPFSVPGARSTVIYDWDRGVDGAICLSGSAIDADGRGGTFIAWISPDGKNSQITRTSPYRPLLVAVAPDDTVWTAGSESMDIAAFRASGRTDVSIAALLLPGAGVIRHYDRAGRTLGAFVPQSTIHDAMSLSDPGNALRASGDRIAWYSAEGRYIEVSLEGKLATDIVVPPPGTSTRPIDGFAITDSGDAFLSASYPVAGNGSASAHRVGIYVLEKSSRAWKAVLERTVIPGTAPNAGDPNDFGHIYGVDGNKLVVAGRQRLRFFTIGN